MDASCLGDHYAEADLCQKLKTRDGGSFFQPLGNRGYDGKSTISFEDDDEKRRWGHVKRVVRAMFSLTGGFPEKFGPYWNPNLSLAGNHPSRKPTMSKRGSIFRAILHEFSPTTYPTNKAPIE